MFFFIYNFVIFKIDKFIFFNLEVDVDSLMGDVDLEIADVSWVMWIFNNILSPPSVISDISVC